MEINWFLAPLSWLIVTFLLLDLVQTYRQAIAQTRQMRRVPCPNCSYFTNISCLKCPIHPIESLSSEAIDCQDFMPRSS